MFVPCRRRYAWLRYSLLPENFRLESPVCTVLDSPSSVQPRVPHHAPVMFCCYVRKEAGALYCVPTESVEMSTPFFRARGPPTSTIYNKFLQSSRPSAKRLQSVGSILSNFDYSHNLQYGFGLVLQPASLSRHLDLPSDSILDVWIIWRRVPNAADGQHGSSAKYTENPH